MSQLPIDPHADSNKRAWLPCPKCNHDCPLCQGEKACEAHWQYRLKHDRNRVWLQCPRCALTWTVNAAADEGRHSDPPQQNATIPLGGRPDRLVTGPSGQVYVMVDDSVKVINRLHHIVATYATGPHPKNMILSADETRVYVAGFDGSTSVINLVKNSVKTFALLRSKAEVISPDGMRLYLVHNGVAADPKGSWISIIGANGSTVAVVPLDRHANGIDVNPAGTKLYVSSRSSSSQLDWRGSISVIDTRSCRVVDKIAMELAPDTISVSRDGTRLYGTHYQKNSVLIIDLRTRGVTRWQFGDAPIDIAVSPDDDFAYVTNLQSLTMLNTTTNRLKTCLEGRMPRAVQLTADGKRAYAIDVSRRIIHALDTADNSILGSLEFDGHPDGMTLGGDGEFLYVTDYLDHTVKVIATASLNRRVEDR